MISVCKAQTTVLARPPSRAVPPRVSLGGRGNVRLPGALVATPAPRKLSKVYGAGKEGGDGSSHPLPFGEAMLQREYNLWERQSELYERLQLQYEDDLARMKAERESWQEREAALKAEAAELRAQLMYVMSQLGAAQGTAGGPVVGGGAPPAYSATSQQAQISGRQPAGALPPGLRDAEVRGTESGAEVRAALRAARSTASSTTSSTASSPAGGGRLSPAEQVQAVVEAMKAGAGSRAAGVAPPTPAAGGSSSSSSASSSPVSASAAWPEGGDELPAYALDLARAVADVDNTDVMSGLTSYFEQALRSSGLAESLAEAAAAAASVPSEAPPAQRQQQPAAAATPAAPAPAAAAPPPAKEEAPAEGGGASEETQDRGPPPPLILGADDIFWVNQLHTALTDLGYYPGDDDIETFFFGEGTQSALMTMQCCEGLEETGVADMPTWQYLLGPDLIPKPSRDLTADMMLNLPGVNSLLGGSSASSSSSSAGAEQQQQQEQPAAKPYAELFTAAFSETLTPAPGGGVRDEARLTVTDTVAAGDKVVSETVQVSSTATKAPKKHTEWPVLHEGDGGQEVHALHVALTRAGYYPSEDDERWWTFGDGTLAALKTFQACNGYPESGVCDANTWRMLLGQDANPAEIADMRSGDSADEDLGNQGAERVWLMGEQRWEDRSRLKKK